ncbi:peptidoglycan bridge formation glycyltransferase FemA/FemB family protein, partial [Holdemanella biformis]|uniref:peptidoglycan bridge formation glycyltransferase FemA/FemB family protein n=1 Tax=Holdemanella biformis TaxID=1735 RepID=UPI0022E05376
MSYLFFKNINQEEFDEFVEKHECCNLLQSYNWAKVKKNWDHMYTGVYKDNELVATGLVLIKTNHSFPLCSKAHIGIKM